jgi:hypothetical protein
MMVDMILAELKDFGKALREEDREVYYNMLKKPLKKIGAISYASSMHVWAFILLSILLEQEKKYESMVDGRLQERE